MKDSKDKNIQERLDKKLKGGNFRPLPGDDEDARIYQLLYQNLAEEPGYKISADFVDKVVGKVRPGGLGWFFNPDHRPLFLGIALIALVSFGVFWLVKQRLGLPTLSISSNTAVSLIMGIIILVLIQVADQKLLKSKIFKALK